MLATARYDLGLSAAEFFALTLPQFNALVERHELEHQRSDHRFGMLCATVLNMFAKKEGGGPWRPADFFPALEEVEAEPKRMSWEEQLRRLKFMFPPKKPAKPA